MKITVKVKPNARENSVKQLESDIYEVKVTASPEKGKANKKVIELIAKYLNFPKSSVQIISGFSSKQKIIQIS